ncbi:hypothetical protein F5144DRAFT_609228 [Chaetomium tenue]|uniref:Uncharacterized protein n=1 Tax=Chaetomium tenue TaxID=1854479 RepID=A0ACB7PGI1_9PEZI|nr:hypothetical protein F5144DRAFT_609228 [Chaetomium globosum]
MPSTAFFSLHTGATDARTLSLLLEYVHQPSNMVLDSQKHTITMHPTEGRATITSTSHDGVTASEEIFLLADSIMLVDFLPLVFDNTVRPMYAIATDRVAVLMNPFTAGIKGSERPLIWFKDNMFEDVFPGRIKIVPQPEGEDMSGNNKSGGCVLEDALNLLFEKDMSCRKIF